MQLAQDGSMTVPIRELPEPPGWLVIHHILPSFLAAGSQEALLISPSHKSLEGLRHLRPRVVF